MKIFVFLFLIGQILSFQAFGFGPKRKVENVFFDNKCRITVMLASHLNGEWLVSAIKEHLTKTGWKEIEFVNRWSDGYEDSLMVRFSDEAKQNNGAKCVMSSSVGVYAYLHENWRTLAEEEEVRVYNCLNWEKRSEVLQSLFDTIPTCKINHELSEIKKPKEELEINEKHLVEPGEELKR
jgi:hypothetical protein